MAAGLRRAGLPRRQLLVAAAAALVVAVCLLFVMLWRVGNGPKPSGAEVDRAAAPGRAAPMSDGTAVVKEPLSGTIDVLVWNPEDPSRRGLSITDHRALPLRSKDQVRVEARLNRPAYVYLVWIDGEGRASPLYPWKLGLWKKIPDEQSPVRQINLPEVADEGWPVTGKAGMETLLLLAHDTRLPSDIDLPGLLADLPSQQTDAAAGLLRFVDGRLTEGPQRLRAVDVSRPTRIDDPVLRTQRLIHERLGPYFTLNRAISFASQGGTK